MEYQLRRKICITQKCRTFHRKAFDKEDKTGVDQTDDKP